MPPRAFAAFSAYFAFGMTFALLNAIGAVMPLRGPEHDPVPCHNDLLPQNLMLEGRRVRIIDYQLSGNNDPAFDLGDIAAEAEYDPDQVDHLTRAYLGDPRGSGRITFAARVRLNMILSNLAWTLWFVVHHGLLRPALVDFDYEAEAGGKFARAVLDLDGPDFGRLIDAVRGRHAPPP